MEQISQFITPLANLFRFHKGKIALTIFLALFFFLLKFPYNDLSDLVTSEVAKATRNQVFIQFDKLGFSLTPAPAIKLNDVIVSTAQLPTLKAGSLTIAPSISSLLAFKPGFSISADNLFKGELDVTQKSGDAIENVDGMYLQNIDLNYAQLNLADLIKTFSIPLKINGSADINLQVAIDPTFKDQPDGNIVITAKKITIPPATIPTQMGPIAMPKMVFAPVRLKGRLSNNEFLIQELTLGKNPKQIQIDIKGKATISFNKFGNNVRPKIGAYELKIDAALSSALEKSSLGIFLSIYDKYKTRTNSGIRYRLKLSAARPGVPPRDSSL